MYDLVGCNGLKFAFWIHGVIVVATDRHGDYVDGYIVRGLRTENKHGRELLLLMSTDEIFGSSKALWTSPDNTFIAYIQFNDTGVPTAHIPVYSDPESLYGRFVDIPYPKVERAVVY